ncbi:hypothetical protein ACQPZJ_41545 [Actinoplanes sp. CA-054009]
MAAYTAARYRGGWTMTHLRQALADRFDDLGRVLVRSRNQRERRLAFEVGADLGRWTHDELVRFAVHAKDPLIRLRSVDAVSATADAGTLRLLVRSRFSGVRASALVGLTRLGLDDEVAALMDDPAPIVRAYARSRATDPLAYYRAAVSAGSSPTAATPTPATTTCPRNVGLTPAPTAASPTTGPRNVGLTPAPTAASPTTGPRDVGLTPATVAGLGEVGRYSDEKLLVPLLRHDDPRIRAAAIKALAAIDCLHMADVGPLTRDPSAAVAKTARKTLGSRGMTYEPVPPMAP